MDKTEIWTNIGVVIAGLLGIVAGYFGKRKDNVARPESSDAIVAGVGVEFGNRLQTDQIIQELKRCADALAILADRKQATAEAKLDRILQEMAEAEERDREERAKAPPARPRPRRPRAG